MRRPSLIPALAALLSMSLVAARSGPASAGTLVVAQDGQGNSTNCDAPTTTPYTTIGGAVAAAQAGDRIQVCPGVYNEQIVITKPLTLRGENGAVIKPSPMVANTTSLTSGNPLAVVIVVDSTAGVTIERLTLDGADNGLACTPSLFGVFYRNASGLVRDNVIKNMRPGLASCSSSGTGVLVQSAQGGSSIVTIESNSIHDYQKNGITANEVGTDIRMRKRNVVAGLGSVTGVVQNGIQLAFGAIGVIEDNVVTDHVSADCVSVAVCPANANDIIVFQSSDSYVIRNILGRSQTGVFVEGDRNQVRQNVVFDTRVFDGIAVFGDRNEIRHNDITRSEEAGVFADGNHNRILDNRINEAAFGILKSDAGNVIAGNHFFNTPTPDPPAPAVGSRVSPQR